MESLEDRVAFLEEYYRMHSGNHLPSLRQRAREEARIDALEIMLEEIASHLGVTHDEFSARFVDLQYRSLAAHLDQARTVSARLAAELDDRSLEQIDIGDEIPPLFGPRDSDV